MHDKLLTISDAAKLLGVSASTLRRLERNGVVEGYGLKVIYTPGGQRRYLLDEIQQLFTQSGFSGQVGFGKQPALLIRDLTIAFTDPNSKLSIEPKQQIEATKSIVNAAVTKDIPMIFSRTVYDPSNHASLLWSKKFPSLQVLMQNSHWVHIHPELADVNYDLINSTTYITDFYRSQVGEFLQFKNVDTLIIAGATTSGSIRATAVDGIQRGYHVIIPEEAVGDRTETLQTSTLLDLNARYADVMSVDKIIEYIHSI